MNCPVCRYPNHDEARICVQCGASLVAQVSEARDLHLGEIVGGRFRVLSLVGQGGMGRVYLAEQPMGRTFRKVAIKTLQAHHARNPQALARFERECALVCRLEHSNTIQVFDFGEAPNGDLYIAMEYVDGRTLAEVLEIQGPMPEERVILVLQQICGALEEAHRHGIVHRDLKPHNVMLTTRAGRADFVKLLDFGIAKGQMPDGAHASELTQQGSVLGTPRYMSPEQFRGEVVDARSDIYSLGMIAYELLTGELPYHAKTPWEWAAQHLTAQPMPLEGHALGARVAPSTRAAIMRALQKDRTKRQASARELLEELTGAEAEAVGLMPTQPDLHVETAPPIDVVPGGETVLRVPTFVERERQGDFEGSLSPVGAEVSRPAKTRARLWPKPLKSLYAAFALVPFALVIAFGNFADCRQMDDAPALPGLSGRQDEGPGERPAQPKETGDCPAEMAAIPGGSYWMGSQEGHADERPTHRVTVEGFCMDTTEVTVAAYSACVRSGACSPAAMVVDWEGLSASDRQLWSQLCNGDRSDRQDHPVNCVDWQDATTYCAFMGKRLPTEEEWEYAARSGGELRTYPWGEEMPDPARLNACGSECVAMASRFGKSFASMYAGNDGWESTAKVGSYPHSRTAHGLYDMAGNVWEWTSSRHCAYSGKGCIDSRPVSRGGGFGSHEPADVRATKRRSSSPTSRSNSLGFRCASTTK